MTFFILHLSLRSRVNKLIHSFLFSSSTPTTATTSLCQPSRNSSIILTLSQHHQYYPFTTHNDDVGNCGWNRKTRREKNVIRFLQMQHFPKVFLANSVGTRAELESPKRLHRIRASVSSPTNQTTLPLSGRMQQITANKLGTGATARTEAEERPTPSPSFISFIDSTPFLLRSVVAVIAVNCATIERTQLFAHFPNRSSSSARLN